MSKSTWKVQPFQLFCQNVSLDSEVVEATSTVDNFLEHDPHFLEHSDHNVEIEY